MTTLTVTAKGQITLRRELLQHLGAQPGQQLDVQMLSNGVLAIQAKAPHGLEAFAGCLPSPARALSLEEIAAVAAEGWAARR